MAQSQMRPTTPYGLRLSQDRSSVHNQPSRPIANPGTMISPMTHLLVPTLSRLALLASLAACVPSMPPQDGSPVKDPGAATAAAVPPPPAYGAPMPLPPPPGYGPAPTAPGYAPVPRGYAPGPVATGVPPPPMPSADADGSKPPAARTATGARNIGSGTAFAVSQRGLAVTNAHVVAGCSAVTDEQGRPMRVVAADRQRDLALLETGRSFPAIVRFRGQGGASLGETALVFGYPYGQALGTGINLTNGIVTGTSGIGGDQSRFQMNAAVQPGNSGGPVVDDSGLLLGVAVGRLNDLAVLRATGALPQGINFAIRAESVERFLAAHGVQPQRGDGLGGVGAQAVSARVAPAVFQIMCRG